MTPDTPFVLRRIAIVSLILLLFLLLTLFLAISLGSTGGIQAAWAVLIQGAPNLTLETIIWRIRFPRALIAALAGAALSLGGLVFQALLRNPLAEPYILGISGGAAVGAILGILAGLARFPGVAVAAFCGSMATLALVLMMSAGQTALKKDSLLLSGVMVNAFCSAIITFLISMTQDARIHNILFWIMGDLSLADLKQVGLLAGSVFPCFLLIFWLSHPMNLLLMGKEMAHSLGVHTRRVTVLLLIATSFMVSATVCHCGLLGFVGLVMPHLLRLILGPDHRVLAPACILAGGGYMVLCDLLARTLPQQGEIPAGVITALIGAPLFILLLRRSRG